ncbi:MAG: GNAT family N-acetyltransferase [Candidatus Rhabdochlamydia sp.]
MDERKRGQGIGTQLFKRAEILARTKNCDYIKLFTWAFQAVGFYKKLGFECVGTIPKWIENYDAVFFKKKLNNENLNSIL